MIKIKTASFFDSENHEGRCFSIAHSQPSGRKHPEIRALAPPWSIVRDLKYGRITEQEYQKIYIEKILMRTSPMDIMRSIGEIVHGSVITFLCWEREGLFCHRRIVADWFRSAGFPDLVVEVH